MNKRDWYVKGYDIARKSKSHPDRLYQEEWMYQLDRIEKKEITFSEVVEMFDEFKCGVMDYYRTNMVHNRTILV